jgi:hypothetical protein
MTKDELIAEIETVIARCRAEDIPPPPPPQIVTVPSGGDIAAAFAAGLPVHLEAGGEYGGVTLQSFASLYGNGAHIHGVGRPALSLAPAAVSVYAENLTCTSDYRSEVVQLGDATAAQNTIKLVPDAITIVNVTVPTHRGKRGFAIHATDVLLENCSAFDVWDPGLADSQGIWIHNTPGSISIIGGTFEAASENIMVGGDSVKIPGNTPTGILIDGVTLQKPLGWQTDGTNRAVKNLLELKASRNVVIRNCVLDGTWTASQSHGCAFVFTPKNANIVDGVLVEDCVVRNAGALVQLMGLDYNTVTPQATRNIVFRRVQFTLSKAQFGGLGGLTTMTGGMKDVIFDQCSGTHDGSQMVISDSSATYGQQGPVTITGCTMPTGQYGLKADGVNYGDALAAGSVYIGQELLIGSIAGNTFSGAPSRFKTNFPDNIWV